MKAIMNHPRLGKTQAAIEEIAAEIMAILTRERNYWLGKTITVFQCKFSEAAYTDSTGKKCPADVIVREINITIYDTIVVSSLWLTPQSRKVGLGLYAKDEYGNIYENNVSEFFVESKEPRALWRNESSGNWIYNPTGKPYNQGGVPILKLDGTLMMP